MVNKLKEILCWSPVNATKDIGPYSNKERNFFLLGMLGQNIIYSIVGSVVQVFYTDILLVPAIAISFVMGISRIWDGANDLFMGTVVDKTHTRWGKCRPYLKFVPIPVAIATVLMFLPVTNTSVTFRIIYIIFSFLLWETLYTLGDIPLWGMTSLMTSEEQKRAKLISAARIVGSLGAIFVVAFYPIKDALGAIDLGLFSNTGKANSDLTYFSEPQGYLFAIILIAIAGGTLFRLPFAHVRERIQQAPKEKDTNFRQNLRLMWENKHYVRVMLASILGCTKNIMLSAGIYFCKWVLGNGGDESVFLIMLGGPFLVGMLISMNRSTWFANKFTKKRMYLLSSYLNAVPYILLFIIGYKSLPFVAVMLAIGGFMTGFSTVYNTTMIADSVDYMEWKKEKRNDGVFFSGMNFIAKLSAAVTAIIVNVMFHLVDYTKTIDALTDSIADAALKGQTYSLNFAQAYPQITTAMFALITLIPAAGCILQALPIHGYSLTESIHSKILNELEQRRSKQSGDEN
ncbi:MAG TPA: glycoside-pentoside-hexuronide (GPH):cation symporter [Clostridiales bacterium]|nr:glycoside-pentoside-hexuronide (GPH):cation symporter [Clostridiales bacterium]